MVASKTNNQLINKTRDVMGSFTTSNNTRDKTHTTSLLEDSGESPDSPESHFLEGSILVNTKS
jgi:hypothetical protein